jgi:hypothetical protein
MPRNLGLIRLYLLNKFYFENSLLFGIISPLNKKVRLKINGNLEETGIRCLNEDNRSVLQRSSVDSFIMAVKK